MSFSTKFFFLRKKVVVDPQVIMEGCYVSGAELRQFVMDDKGLVAVVCAGLALTAGKVSVVEPASVPTHTPSQSLEEGVFLFLLATRARTIALSLSLSLSLLRFERLEGRDCGAGRALGRGAPPRHGAADRGSHAARAAESFERTHAP